MGQTTTRLFCGRGDFWRMGVVGFFAAIASRLGLEDCLVLARPQEPKHPQEKGVELARPPDVAVVALAQEE